MLTTAMRRGRGSVTYRVRRYVRGKAVRDYGAFPCRGLAEYVAQRASEAHMGEAGYVAVEPEKTS